MSDQCWTFILRGKLVACEARAGYGFLPQHLSAVAVEGSDHLQQHAAHDDGPWAQARFTMQALGILFFFLQDCSL